MTTKTQREALDDGRYIPPTRWVTYDGRSYRIRGHVLHMLFARDDRTGETRVHLREIRSGTPRYRAVMMRFVRERRP